MNKEDIVNLISSEFEKLSSSLYKESSYFLQVGLLETNMAFYFGPTRLKMELVMHKGQPLSMVLESDKLSQLLMLKDVKEKDFDNFQDNIELIYLKILKDYTGSGFTEYGTMND